MISVLHPSRQRAYKSSRVTKDWLSRSGSEVELIVSIDENDPEISKYLELYSDYQSTKVIVNNNRSAIDAINNAAKAASGDIFIVVSDDTECQNNWANLILSAVIGHRDYILRVNDGIQKWIVTSPIMDRVYYNRTGYVYHPDYKHMFSDTHLTHVADLLGRIIRRDDITFRHAHYSKGLAQMDDTYRKNDSTYGHGQQVYLRHFKEGFGLGLDPWKISEHGQSHINWLRNVIR